MRVKAHVRQMGLEPEDRSSTKWSALERLSELDFEETVEHGLHDLLLQGALKPFAAVPRFDNQVSELEVFRGRPGRRGIGDADLR